VTGADPTLHAHRAACFVAVLALTSGCQVTPGLGYAGGWERNVSQQTERWGEYRPLGVYRLERDVFLLNEPERTSGPALVAGLESDLPPGTVRGPAAMEDYLAAPDRYRGVIGVVKAGTRVRADVLRAKGNVLDSTVTRHYVRARIIDGDFRERLVDLQALSIYSTDPDTGAVTLIGPNRDFLRLE
jgi:hypothetical protein